MAVCLLVNEDMQKTFTRFKDIKNDKKPDGFMPGEYAQIDTIHYLKPDYQYSLPKSEGANALSSVK